MDPDAFVHKDNHDEQIERFGRCYCFPWGEREPEDRFFRREIMVEISGIYDGGLFYLCPDCGGKWHRWLEGSMLRDKAEAYVNGSSDF